MTKDKKFLYAVSVIILSVLLFALFVESENSGILAAGLLLPMAVAVCFFVRKRSYISINKKEVTVLLAIVGSLYAILTQAVGVIFGYSKNPYFVTPKSFVSVIVPLVIIIVTSEIIRSVLLMQKNRIVDVLAYLICVAAETLMYSDLRGITSFNQFMELVGITFFPAVAANILYHHLSKSFGAKPTVVYRIITTIYIYFIPIVAVIPDALYSCVKVLTPIAVLALVSAFYEKKRKVRSSKGNKLSVVSFVVSLIMLLAITMLTSCQFRFGALVIASDSMTGEINKGDVIIYERYDEQSIEIGQVIVFQKDHSKIVHRVIAIENINGEFRYYTKGDANEAIDAGYITDSEILGLTDIKIAYVGYPSIWMRDMLEN